MNFELSEDLQAIRQLARDVVNKTLIPLEPQVNAEGKVPQEALDTLKELGFYGIMIPEEYGGMGLGMMALVIVGEELAHSHHGFTNEFTLNNGIGSRPLVLGGSEDLKRRYLPDIATGRKITCFGLTEPNAGSDAGAIETTAVKQGNEWVINGTKHFITNGPTADLATVMAVTDPEKRVRGGISAFIVEKGTPGFGVAQIQESMGRPPHPQAELFFQDCRVPESNMIGEPGEGFRLAMTALDVARIYVAGVSVGMSDRLLSMSREYAKQRVQFGKPIASFQAIQWKIADMATEINAARWATYKAAWSFDKGEKIGKEAAMCKLFATEMLGRVADHAVQIHSGMGLMCELAVEGMYRDARALRIYDGTSEMQRLIIAREELK